MNHTEHLSASCTRWPMVPLSVTSFAFLVSRWGRGVDCWGSSHCMTCIFYPGLPVGALGLEHSLWRPGAKLLLGLTLFLIGRNRPLFQEAVNFLVLPKHVFYSAPGNSHPACLPLCPFHRKRRGLQLRRGICSPSRVSYQEWLAGCERQDTQIPICCTTSF